MADIGISLGLEDQGYRAGLDRARDYAERFGRDATRALGGVGSGMGTLVSRVTQLTQRFQGLAGVIGGVGFAALGRQFMTLADEISDTTRALGMSNQAFLEMGQAAVNSGSGVSDLGVMMSRLQQAGQEALSGNQALRQAFDQLGITAGNIRDLNIDQLFNLVAARLGVMGDQSAAAAVKLDLLGRGARTWNPRDYADSIVEVAGTMRDQAQSIDAYAAANDRLAIQTRQIQLEMMRLLEPILNVASGAAELSNRFLGASGSAAVLATAIGALVAAPVISGVSTVIGLFGRLGIALGLIRPAFEGITGAAAATAAATTIAGTASARSAVAATALAGAYARVVTATMAVNVAEAQLTAIKQQSGVTDVTLAAATDRLTAARARLATMTQAYAATEASVGVSLGATAAASTAAATATTGLTAASTGAVAATGTLATTAASAATATTALGAASSGAAAGLAAVGAAATGALASLGRFLMTVRGITMALLGLTAAAYSTDLNIGEDQDVRRIADIDRALRNMSKAQRENYTRLSDQQRQAISGELELQGQMLRRQEIMDRISGQARIVPGQEQARSGAAALATLRTARSGGGWDPTQAQQSQERTDRQRQVREAEMARASQQQVRDQIASIQSQTQLMISLNDRARERVRIEQDLVGAIRSVRESRLAQFDAETRQREQVAAIDERIRQTQSQALARPELKRYYDQVLASLQQQRQTINEITVGVSAQKFQQMEAANQEEMRVAGLQQSVAAAQQLLDITTRTAQVGRTQAEAARLAGEQQIQNAAQSLIQQRQAQMGRVPLGEEERLRILEQTRQAFAGVLTAQQALIAAEQNRRVTVDLANQRLDTERSIRDIQTQITTQTMPTLQAQETQLLAQARQRAQAYVDAARLAGQPLTTDQTNQVFEQARANALELSSVQRQLYENSRTFSTGWQQSMNEFSELITDGSRRARSMFDNLKSWSMGFTETLIGSFRTGRFEISNLVDQILTDLARLSVQRFISEPLMAAVMGGLGQLGGAAFGSFFGGGTPGSMSGTVTTPARPQGAFGARASGGPVSANQPYLVGERGPEMFVPRGFGRIEPINQAPPQNTIVQNIRIDARSDIASVRSAVLQSGRIAQAELNRDEIRGLKR